jgi:periplasmic protein TonB
VTHEYLVSTTVNDRIWLQVWNDAEPLGLDYPVNWELLNKNGTVHIRHLTDGWSHDIKESQLDGKVKISLPAETGQTREVKVRVRKLKRARPAYLPDFQAFESIGPANLYMSSGILEHLIHFAAVDDKYLATLGEASVFSVDAGKELVQITALHAGVRFKIAGQVSRLLPVGKPISLHPAELEAGAFILGSYWWRLANLPEPELIDPDELDEERNFQDSIPLKTLGRLAGAILVLALVVSRGFYYLDSILGRHVAPPLVAEIELKKPKFIPKAGLSTTTVAIARVEPPQPLKIPPPAPTRVAAVPRQALSNHAVARKASAPLVGTAVAKARQKTKGKTTVAKSLKGRRRGSSAKPNALARNPKAKPSAKPTTSAASRSLASASPGRSPSNVKGRVLLGAYGSTSGGGIWPIAGGEMTISGIGKIAESEVEWSLAEHLKKFQYCYEAALAGNPTLAGNVQMQWTISPSGSVSEARVLNSSLKNTSLHSCLVRELGQFTFSNPQGGAVTIKKTFSLQSSAI